MTQHPHSKPHAVIFDMDGVLVDTEPLYVKVNQQLFEELGIAMSVEEQLAFVGISSADMWHIIREKFTLSQPIETLLQLEMDAMYHTLKTLPFPDLIPGITELLNILRNSKIRLGIASSSRRTSIELITTRTGLKTYLDAVVSGDDVTLGKPDPEIFLTAAERLGVIPENCLVIEDSPYGITGAKNAKMRCVGFQNPNSGNQDLSRADLVIENFSPQNIQKILRLISLL